MKWLIIAFLVITCWNWSDTYSTCDLDEDGKEETDVYKYGGTWHYEARRTEQPFVEKYY